jgi:hypothetical protein
VLRLSPLSLPWTTLRLAGRFALPLALWYTVGQAIRYGLFVGGYYFGVKHTVVPILVLSLVVMATLAVTVAMVHSVRDGLPAVRKRELDESLTSWKSQEEETIANALTRALLPFMIFYLAWNWFGLDAQAFEQSAASRGFAEGGFEGQFAGMKSITQLTDHVYIAIALTAGFLVLKFIGERFVEPKWSRVGSVLVAYFEVNWTLFGIFSVNRGREIVSDWITGRMLWAWAGDLSGPVFGWVGTYWPSFKNAVLGGLVWLVIAGVILGVDSDEKTALGKGKVGRRIVSASGIDRPHTPWEVMTRELRDKWLPTLYGLRMVMRAGLLPFAVFCALFAGLEDAAYLVQRGIYYLLGAHPLAWSNPRLTLVAFGVDLVHQALRVCLMAAAFDLVVARVSARNAAPAPGRHPLPAVPAVPPARPS